MALQPEPGIRFRLLLYLRNLYSGRAIELNPKIISYAFHGLGKSQGSRVSFEMEMRGKGLGALMLPMARRQASRQVAESHEKLKRILEAAS